MQTYWVVASRPSKIDPTDAQSSKEDGGSQQMTSSLHLGTTVHSRVSSDQERVLGESWIGDGMTLIDSEDDVSFGGRSFSANE